MAEMEKKSPISSGWYLLGGVAVGTVAGLLLAPKKGSEMREDIGEWARSRGEKSRSLLSRVGSIIPTRVKAAAVVGAVKGGASEAYQESRDKMKQFSR